MRLRNIIPLTSAESMSAIEDRGILERTRSQWRLSAHHGSASALFTSAQKDDFLPWVVRSRSR